MKLPEKRQSAEILWTLGVLLTLVLVSGSACNHFQKNKVLPSGAGPLFQRAENSADAVGLEVFTIRVTPQQQESIRQLWNETDEQRLPPELRRRLMDNGFRVGFLSDVLTPALSQLINVNGGSDRKEKGSNFGELQEVSVADIPRQVPVTRQYRNLLPNMQAHLKMFDEPLPEFSFLEWEQGCLSGRTYTDALGLICLSCSVEKNGNVRLTMVPELEYGVLERKTVIMQGVLMQEDGKPRRKFPHLTVSLNLLPGQWMVLGSVSEYNTGAGRAFFFRGTENTEQRMLAVRLRSVKKANAQAENTLPVPEKKTDLPFQERQ